jgi:hypothetical protein
MTSDPRRNGSMAENVIADALFRQHVDFSRQVRLYKGIYDTWITVDFVIRNATDFPQGLVIESKWQDCNGTADEKFPYLIANIRICPLPVVIIADGNGARPQATKYLRSQIDRHRLLNVFTLAEFLIWLVRDLNISPCKSFELTPPSNQG